MMVYSRTRQLMQSNLQLKETMDRESSANKQLRLENEQLQWKLRQREQLSHSLPPASLGKSSQSNYFSWKLPDITGMASLVSDDFHFEDH